MKKNYIIKTKNSGSVLAEVLLYLALFTIICSFFFTSFLTGSRAFRRINSGIHKSNEILIANNYIKDRLSHIKTPYWMPEHSIELSVDSIKIFYFDGKTDSFLEISIADSCLTVSNGDEKRIFRSIDRGEFNYSKENRTIQIKVGFKNSDSEIEFILRPSTYPFFEEGHSL